MRIRYIFLLPLLFVTACLQPSELVDSGVEGVVTIGPMCPVMREDVPCPDQPYQADLLVMTTSGGKIVQFQTDQQGHFRVELSPGDYVLHPKESPNGLPFAADTSFTVYEHKFTQLEISYDSGIR